MKRMEEKEIEKLASEFASNNQLSDEFYKMHQFEHTKQAFMIGFKKALSINGVVFNEAGKDAQIVTLELNKPMISKLSDWKKNSEVELICDVEKGTKYRTGVCRNCGGQSN